MKISSIVKNFSLLVINREASGWFAVMILLLLLPSWPLLGQEGSLKPSKVAAQAAWDRGDYEVAYTHFNGLLLLYSRDPVYKYYTGACLTESQRDIPRAAELLGSAINSSVNIKSVPDEVWFYYGRALQMSGNFHDAADAYDRFARAAGRRLAQEYDVQGYIDQCSRGEGALDVVQVAAVAARKEDSGEPTRGKATQSPESGWTENTRDTAHGTEPSSVKATEGEALLRQGSGGRSTEPSSVKAAEGEVKVSSNGAPDEYDRVFAAAVKLQHEADSLAAIADAAESDMEKMALQADDPMRMRAAESREKADARQAEADALFLKLEDNSVGLQQQAAEAVTAIPQPTETAAAPEPTSTTTSNLPPVTTPGPAQTRTSAPTPDPVPQLFSLFEVRSKPVYSAANPVPIDKNLPDGLVYTIQIAAFKNVLDPSLFKGLYPVYGKLKKETGITFYYTGFFRRPEDARQALPKAREAGFPDAFVIALMNDIRVSMERAAQLGKEWGVKPLPFEGETSTAEEKSGPENARMVGTLSFRAEVMRTDSPTPEMIEKIQLLAGQRGLDIIENNEGETVFLIGNFITFESAEDYVSLLIRNGYSTARVAAWVGRYEIPVEAARELLKRLPDD
jgi:tetratricopeptide (TPR) repeat protein